MGEIVAMDTARVAHAICAFTTKYGLCLRFSEPELYRELTYYVWLRLRGRSTEEIRGQRGSWPTGWDDASERIWIEWLSQTVLPSWQSAVWDNAFGRDEQARWEEQCAGWRLEVVSMFPYWVERNLARFAEIDPTPFELPDHVAEIRAAVEASDGDGRRKRR
jgi:hypothetical protein